MSTSAGPSPLKNSLMLSLDPSNKQSFKGESTTNLLPNPTVNAYPVTGNTWGTYNVNRYNSNTYFSIGTISSVTDNIVTTATSHPLRTYDVVRPQTTGGGVTAGTDYFVKKISATTFSLHAYNNSQDGSQGYINTSTGNHKVYDSIATDTRVAINSTSFPTMWWGAPHLPNSGLVKEIRTAAFNGIPGQNPTNCIRLHYIRSDNVKDGMAYGVDATVTPSSPVTVSFYVRAADPRAQGKSIQLQIYNYTGGSATNFYNTFTLPNSNLWERRTYTFTPLYGTMTLYWFPQSSGVYSWDMASIQVEQKSYATSFVAGTRGSTVATGGGWADLSGGAKNASFTGLVTETSKSIGFDGTTGYATVTDPGLPQYGWSIEVIVKANSFSNSPIFVCPTSNGVDQYLQYNTSGNFYFALTSAADLDNRGHQTTHAATVGQYNHYIVTRDASSINIYVNGELNKTATDTVASAAWSSTWVIGARGNATYFLNGEVGLLRAYSKVLTASEARQNFASVRGRYGI